MKTLNNTNRHLTAPVHDMQPEIVQYRRHAGKLIALTLLAFAIPASAEQHYYSGGVCQPVIASRNIVEYDQYGVYNASATAVANVECALPNDAANGNLLSVFVAVYDRSTTANVSCTARQTSWNGDLVWQQTRSSTGGGPGTKNVVTLFFGNVSPYPLLDAYFLSVRCSLPRKQSGWPSVVTSFITHTVN